MPEYLGKLFCFVILFVMPVYFVYWYDTGGAEYFCKRSDVFMGIEKGSIYACELVC